MANTTRAIGGIGPSGYDVRRELEKRNERVRRAAARKAKRHY